MKYLFKFFSLYFLLFHSCTFFFLPLFISCSLNLPLSTRLSRSLRRSVSLFLSVSRFSLSFCLFPVFSLSLFLSVTLCPSGSVFFLHFNNDFCSYLIVQEPPIFMGNTETLSLVNREAFLLFNFYFRWYLIVFMGTRGKITGFNYCGPGASLPYREVLQAWRRSRKIVI